MWGGVPIFVVFAPSWCFSIEAVNHLCPSNKPKKLVSGLVIQIIAPKDLQERTTILQLKVYIVSVMKNKLGTYFSRSVLLIWLHSFSHLRGMQDLWIISCFFFHKVWHHKVKLTDPNFCKFRGLGLKGLKAPKIRFLGFWQKPYPFRYAFLFQYEVPMFFLYFLPKQHVCKSLVLELWSKNLRMQDSLNHNISQKTWGIKLNFWIWLDARESAKY